MSETVHDHLSQIVREMARDLIRHGVPNDATVRITTIEDTPDGPLTTRTESPLEEFLEDE